MRLPLTTWFLLISLTSFSQRFKYDDFERIRNEHFQNGCLVENYLPKNVDKSGKTDYTFYIQKALNENYDLVFPNFPILISDRGLILRSNQKILFQENSKLVLKKSFKPAYRLLHLFRVENVRLFYVSLEGDGFRHGSSEGEWGHGIQITASRNVNIYSPSIEKCWGDGIYIGNYLDEVSENVVIDNGDLDYNRRNGISIISGRNIRLSNLKISNTSGKNPQSGIDIEPNSNYDVLENIRLDDIETAKNDIHGIVVSTSQINGKPILIKINNHKDSASKIGVGISLASSKFSYPHKLSGMIILKSGKYIENKDAAIKFYTGKDHAVSLHISQIQLDVSAIVESSEMLLNFLKVNNYYNYQISQ